MFLCSSFNISIIAFINVFAFVCLFQANVNLAEVSCIDSNSYFYNVYEQSSTEIVYLDQSCDKVNTLPDNFESHFQEPLITSVGEFSNLIYTEYITPQLHCRPPPSL